MSRIYTAGQYEQDFLPHRLSNWLAPDGTKQQATSASGAYGTLKARPAGARTQFIADHRGHLLPGVGKTGSAFVTGPPPDRIPGGASPPRWPSPGVLLTTLPSAPAATMGHKGIVTDYLPASTVTIKAVEIPGCRERAFQ